MQGVLFFANARCHLCNRLGQLQTSETDFLIVRKGIFRILEVDGKTFRPDASIDFKLTISAIEPLQELESKLVASALQNV